MSQFTAIRAVSKTLQLLLQDAITNSPDPQVQGVPIELASPRELRDAATNAAVNAVSLWLYRVARNADLLNAPPERVDDVLTRQPLPVNLYYLVAPITATSDNEQALLGKVLQVFADHTILGGTDLQDDLEGETTELRLTFETLTLEELTRIWTSLGEPYQLSASYRVQVVRIDSALAPIEVRPVYSRRTDYQQIVGGS